MSITVKTIKCPECGATLQIEEDRSQLYCSYCGTPIIITNENEHIIRYVDEAEIIKAETNKMVSLNEINKEESSNHEESHRQKEVHQEKELFLDHPGKQHH